MRTDFISEIPASGQRHWCSGVFAIEHVPSGRRHYVGTRNVGRRVRDNLNWLDLGVHPSPDLQAAWSQSPCDEFRVVLVERVAVPGLLKFVKQCWIDRDRQNGLAVPYNRKNAAPRVQSPVAAGNDDLLPSGFFDGGSPSGPPEDLFDYIERVLGEGAFENTEPLTVAEKLRNAERLIKRAEELRERGWETRQ